VEHKLPGWGNPPGKTYTLDVDGCGEKSTTHQKFCCTLNYVFFFQNLGLGRKVVPCLNSSHHLLTHPKLYLSKTPMKLTAPTGFKFFFPPEFWGHPWVFLLWTSIDSFFVFGLDPAPSFQNQIFPPLFLFPSKISDQKMEQIQFFVRSDLAMARKRGVF